MSFLIAVAINLNAVRSFLIAVAINLNAVRSFLIAVVINLNAVRSFLVAEAIYLNAVRSFLVAEAINLNVVGSFLFEDEGFMFVVTFFSFLFFCLDTKETKNQDYTYLTVNYALSGYFTRTIPACLLFFIGSHESSISLRSNSL
jgi:hypothetical protein